MTMKLASLPIPVPLATALLGCLVASCGTLETARVVSLEDVPPSESVWRPEREPHEPDFLDTSYWLKRSVKTSMTFVPDVEEYVRAELTEALGEEPDELRLEYHGYRYAYYFPSRHDDFVLRVALKSRAAGLSGEFEGVLRGIDLLHAYEMFGESWEQEVPNTLPDPDAQYTVERALERWADRRAYQHRLSIRLATRRLIAKVLASRS